jgi:hypothetical protein
VTYVPIDCLVVSSALYVGLARLGHATDYTHPKPYQNSLPAGYSVIQVAGEFVRRLAFLNLTRISAHTPMWEMTPLAFASKTNCPWLTRRAGN